MLNISSSLNLSVGPIHEKRLVPGVGSVSVVPSLFKNNKILLLPELHKEKYKGKDHTGHSIEAQRSNGWI